MALIKCSECEKEVSNKAAACLGCGAPFESEAKGSSVKRLTTTQRTSKSIKFRGALAGIIIIVGIYSTDTLILSIGFIWFILNRTRKWWHHD